MIYRISLLLLFACLSTAVLGQFSCPPIYGKRSEGSLHVAAGAGPTFLYGDIDKPKTAGRAVFIALDYSIIPGLDIGIEGQIGSLEALGDVIDLRQVKNNYRTGGIMLKVFPFKFITEKRYTKPNFVKTLKNSFYLGAGVLGIVNNYDEIYRDPTLLYTYGPISYEDDNGDPVFKKRINSVTMPTVNVGFAVPINQMYARNGKYWSVLLNGQFNYANNDLLDGYTPYDQGGRELGKNNDMYSFYSLGVRYSF